MTCYEAQPKLLKAQDVFTPIQTIKWSVKQLKALSIWGYKVFWKCLNKFSENRLYLIEQMHNFNQYVSGWLLTYNFIYWVLTGILLLFLWSKSKSKTYYTFSIIVHDLQFRVKFIIDQTPVPHAPTNITFKSLRNPTFSKSLCLIFSFKPLS